MTANFADKVVIVTGAAQGGGKGVAIGFAKQGAHVIVADLQTKIGQATCEELRTYGGTATFVYTDLSSEASIVSLVRLVKEKYGHIDVLASCAGIYPVQDIESMTQAQWGYVLAVNMTAPFLLTRESVPLMKGRPHGRIIFTTTVTGPIVVLPGMAHYAASKSGLEGFMRTAALELAQHRITVNAVAPGALLSPGLQKVCSPEEIEKIGRRIPLGRIGQPADIAAAYLFLASPEAEYITGITIRCDGGYVLPEPAAIDVS